MYTNTNTNTNTNSNNTSDTNTNTNTSDTSGTNTTTTTTTTSAAPVDNGGHQADGEKMQATGGTAGGNTSAKNGNASEKVPLGNGVNAGGWFWTEKDYTRWAQESLKEMFTNLELYKSADSSCTITHAAFDGDVVLNVVRKKLRAFLDLSFRMEWHAELMRDGQAVSGEGVLSTVDEISYDTLESFTIRAKAKSETTTPELVAHVAEHALPVLRQKMRAWFDLFWSEKAQPDKHLTNAPEKSEAAMPPLTAQPSSFLLDALTTTLELEKLELKKDLCAIWDSLSVKKGWFKPSMTYQQAEPVVDEACEVIVRVCATLNSGGHHLKPLHGSAREYLWSLLYQPMDLAAQRGAVVQGLVQAAFTDTEGFVNPCLSEKYLQECIALWASHKAHMEQQRCEKANLVRTVHTHFAALQGLTRALSDRAVEPDTSSVEELAELDKKLAFAARQVQGVLAFMEDLWPAASAAKKRRLDEAGSAAPPAQAAPKPGAPKPAAPKAEAPPPVQHKPEPAPTPAKAKEAAPTPAPTPAAAKPAAEPAKPKPKPKPKPIQISISDAPPPPPAPAKAEKQAEKQAEKAAAASVGDGIRIIPGRDASQLMGDHEAAMKTTEELRETLLRLRKGLKEHPENAKKIAAIEHALENAGNLQDMVRNFVEKDTPAATQPSPKPSPKAEREADSGKEDSTDWKSVYEGVPFSPKFEVAETPFAYNIAAYIPHMAEAPKVSVENDGTVLRLTGARLPTPEEHRAILAHLDGLLEEQGIEATPDQRLAMVQRVCVGRFGRFSETYRIPANVDMHAIEATYENGRFVVELPKLKSKLEPLRSNPRRTRQQEDGHPPRHPFDFPGMFFPFGGDMNGSWGW